MKIKLQFVNGGALLCALVITAHASGQATQRAAFVANDGNLQGSVTSFTFNADGSPQLVDFVITGQKANSWEFHPGTNANSIAISPSGEYLAVGHATGNPPAGYPPGRRVTILRVNADATIVIHGTFQVPSTPLDLLWLDNEYLATTETSLNVANRVHVFHFDWETNQLLPHDSQITGNFTTSLAMSPDGTYLYANNSSGNTIAQFQINADFTLTHVQTISTGSVYPLGMGIAPNGHRLYFGGGISAGGKAVMGYRIDENNGNLTIIPGSPFTSPGSSPKQVVVSSDNQFAVVGHGTDATVRTFIIDQPTGALTPTGSSMSAGSQGSLGNIAVLDNLVLAADRDTFSDGVQGLHCLTLNPDGTMTPNGPPVPTQGIWANDIAVWSVPLCPADLTGDGSVDVSDMLALLGQWGPCPDSCAGDLNGDGAVDVSDLLLLLAAWGTCP